MNWVVWIISIISGVVMILSIISGISRRRQFQQSLEQLDQAAVSLNTAGPIQVTSDRLREAIWNILRKGICLSWGAGLLPTFFVLDGEENILLCESNVRRRLLWLAVISFSTSTFIYAQWIQQYFNHIYQKNVSMFPADFLGGTIPGILTAGMITTIYWIFSTGKLSIRSIATGEILFDICREGLHKPWGREYWVRIHTEPPVRIRYAASLTAYDAAGNPILQLKPRITSFFATNSWDKGGDRNRFTRGSDLIDLKSNAPIAEFYTKIIRYYNLQLNDNCHTGTIDPVVVFCMLLLAAVGG